MRQLPSADRMEGDLALSVGDWAEGKLVRADPRWAPGESAGRPLVQKGNPQPGHLPMPSPPLGEGVMRAEPGLTVGMSMCFTVPVLRGERGPCWQLPPPDPVMEGLLWTLLPGPAGRSPRGLDTDAKELPGPAGLHTVAVPCALCPWPGWCEEPCLFTQRAVLAIFSVFTLEVTRKHCCRLAPPHTHG